MANGDFHDMTEREILVKLSTKLDYIEKSFTSNIQELRNEMKNYIKLQEEDSECKNIRISSLENWRNYIGGALVIISIIFGIAYDYVMTRVP